MHVICNIFSCIAFIHSHIVFSFVSSLEVAIQLEIGREEKEAKFCMYAKIIQYFKGLIRFHADDSYSMMVHILST